MRAPGSHWLAAAVLIASAGGCASSGGTEPSPPAPAGRSDAEIEALFRARQDSARMRFTAADVDFMTGMIHHHAQALHMTRLAIPHGASPQVQTLAARITNAQRDEIALMQQWLRDRDQPIPKVHVTDSEVAVHGPGHAHDMPGMLTPDQLRELEAARDAAFDRTFLTLMIQHHRGAVTMVHELFATDGAAQDEEAFRIASDVQVDQITEIARMESMLEAMGQAGGS